MNRQRRQAEPGRRPAVGRTGGVGEHGMLRGPRDSKQRLLILVGGVLFLPAIILMAWALTVGLLRARSQVEQSALATAGRILTSADNRLSVYQGIVSTYSTASSLADRDWIRARARAQDVLELNEGWTALLVVQNSTGRVILDTRQPGGGVPLTLPTRADTRPAVVRDGAGCPCVVLRHPIRRLPGHSVVALIRPDVFQADLLKLNEPRAVAALVDADGDFIGRSLDFKARVGTPATSFVRAALARGGKASTAAAPSRVSRTTAPMSRPRPAAGLPTSRSTGSSSIHRVSGCSSPWSAARCWRCSRPAGSSPMP